MLKIQRVFPKLSPYKVLVKNLFSKCKREISQLLMPAEFRIRVPSKWYTCTRTKLNYSVYESQIHLRELSKFPSSRAYDATKASRV